jgi:hypothetical protein
MVFHCTYIQPDHIEMRGTDTLPYWELPYFIGRNILRQHGRIKTPLSAKTRFRVERSKLKVVLTPFSVTF